MLKEKIKRCCHYDVVRQNGRTMTEMLGVLAIIGILTITAISGFEYVRDKIQANQIMKEALTEAAEIKTKIKLIADDNAPDDYYGTEFKYPYKEEISDILVRTHAGNMFYLYSKPVSEGVCNKLLLESAAEFSEDRKRIISFVSIYDANSSVAPSAPSGNTVCAENNIMVFAIKMTSVNAVEVTSTNSVGAVCKITSCPANQVLKNPSNAACYCTCEAGYVMDNGNCIENKSCFGKISAGHCCPSDEDWSLTDEKCCDICQDPGDHTARCLKNNEDKSNGHCCPSGQTYNATAGQCCVEATTSDACATLIAASSGECPYYRRDCDDEYCNISTDPHTCCPSGETYNATAEQCCASDGSTSVECCTAIGRSWNEAAGNCCPSGQTYNTTAGQCCETPTVNYACATSTEASPGVCPIYGRACDDEYCNISTDPHTCCPSGQKYATVDQKCCANGVSSDGVCCANGVNNEGVCCANGVSNDGVCCAALAYEGCTTIKENGCDVCAPCDGILFMGHTNGHTYCIGNDYVIYSNAEAYCASQGRVLATIEEACPDWNDKIGTNSSCLNMRGYDDMVGYGISLTEIPSSNRKLWTGGGAYLPINKDPDSNTWDADKTHRDNCRLVIDRLTNVWRYQTVDSNAFYPLCY